MGGSKYGESRSDGVILNVKTQEVTTINPASQIKFVCKSESFLVKQGVLLSLVCNDDSIHLVRYNLAENAITSVLKSRKYME